MKIQGSCFCKNCRFSAISQTPYPYMLCYCSICRKTAGGGGYAVNIMALADTLEISDSSTIQFHQAKIEDSEDSATLITSPGLRHYCTRCGSALWVSDPRFPQWIYPFASSIDTDLPQPPEYVHIMLEFKASWVTVPSGAGHQHFQRYPSSSIFDWHKSHGLLHND